MRKKIAILLIAVLSIFSLAACSGNNSHEEEIRAVADGFLTAVQDGDFTAAAAFCTEDALADADLEQLATLDKVFYDALGVAKDELGEDAQKSLSDFISTIVSSFVASYEITDVTEDEEGATVLANVTYGFDPNAIENIDIDDELTKLSENYLTENQDELVDIYLNDGESAMMNKVISDIMPEILSAYTKAVMDTGETTDVLQLKLTQQEDESWIISSALVEEPDADTEKSAE